MGCVVLIHTGRFDVKTQQSWREAFRRGVRCSNAMEVMLCF